MFEKILIANRGEIACRVMRTAKKMGIRCVAVYSEADANAMHVAMADEAYYLGPAPARESYLRADLILEIAQRCGAQAIHPGYGFLSENEKFAEDCERAGIAFIGPPASAIEAMGSKSAAKLIMENAGVPLVKGYHGDDQSEAVLQRAADEIGYPVLIKATAGGGGKGMRQVWNSAEFSAALASCKREAANSFGDDKVLVEKYLTKPRHVEIQVFADSHGQAVYLFERDCSVQRRHQKVIEEAPAPGMSDALRAQMGEVACQAARAIGYVGAGTIEFLLDQDGSFYFMEMNTRLQVEHPVTEMITGQDLVEWQLLVASGEPLPLAQDELCINGHAFEVRVYAEDPDQDFLPATGQLKHLRTPKTSKFVRIDTGVREGDSVSIHYDPMIAKLIVWDKDRVSALARLRNALADYQVVGVTTNLKFLSHLAANQAFIDEDIDTGFIARNKDELLPPAKPVSDEVLALASLYTMLKRDAEAKAQAARSRDPHSPWNLITGWRLNEDNYHHLLFVREHDHVREELAIQLHFRPEGYLLELSGTELQVSGDFGPDEELRANINGKRLTAQVVEHDHSLIIFALGDAYRLGVKALSAGGDSDDGHGRLSAPMPGTVIAVMVKAGDAVQKGQALLVLEAMKMEHTIAAPVDGVVAEVLYQAGDQVQGEAELLRFETV
ncbi:MAG: acetyl/propionyl/methylcrotonyl-CoA carboxylase subunit alpha [Gammaproteobacteria bacterium]|nr:acetyl/propionyl/methylcrotonyl-CoA carboxylase subunit alpha [Gammaproteobacteria bacterium]